MKMDAQYTHRRIRNAVETLCSEKAFEERLKYAVVDDLTWLEPAKGEELPEDLKFILKAMKDFVQNGEVRRVPNEEEWEEFIKKLLDILLETYWPLSD
jgi:hypothetical protein